MDEIHRSTDTGFCNRIFYWEGVELLNSYNNYKFKIELEKNYWPELKEMVELPNSILVNNNIISEDFNEITTDFIKENKDNFKLSKSKYYPTYNFNELSYLDDYLITNNERPITKIKLKDIELDNKIKEFCKDKIGIHIRRGRGIIYGKKEINSLPEEVRNRYISFRKHEGEFTPKYYIYEFVYDETYFSVIDMILKINPNQTFYISYDIPEKCISYFKEKYPNKIYDKTYFYEFIKKRYKTPKQHVKNIVDLFCLSNTKFVFKHPMSTWSEFAHRYTEKSAEIITEPLDIIEENISKILTPNN
jgi:hypothetical protein